MPFDALVMAAVTREIQDVLPARVDRIYSAGFAQQAPSEAVLVVFRPGIRTQLLISMHPRFARVHLSFREHRPVAPSPFVLLLRKHLEGAHLVAAQQHDRDRVLILDFCTPLGSRPRLVVEIMGPGSNLILLDQDARVLAAWREEGPRPDRDASRRRILLPGVEYEPPLPPPAGRWGPFSTRELAARARATPTGERSAPTGGQRTPEEVAEEMWQEARSRPRPVVITDESGQPKDYWCLIPVAHGPVGQEYSAMSRLLDDFYCRLGEEEHLREWHDRLARALRRHRERQERLAESLREDLARAREALRYRVWGELLMAQAAHLPAGHDRVEVTDYYSEEPRQVEIPLNPALSGKDNAREYFRKYSKARRALDPLRQRLDQEATHLAYLEQLEQALSRASDRDTLEVLQREMEAAGIVATPPARAAPANAARERPVTGQHRVLRFSLPGGDEVLVGRGAEANDFLTFVLARPDDIWLHVRGIPGSHVILRPPAGRPPSPEAIARAATIAAHFSQARLAPKVEVDWTLRKHVRRKPGAKPGQVVYREERTLLVRPAPPPGSP
ncbi:MAG: NFACT RNA binding domain-containing protein [Bacillota bacterium]